MRKILLSVFLFTVSLDLTAQCSFSVSADANPEIICGSGNNTVALDGFTNASNIEEEFWEPAGLVDDPFSPSTIGTVTGPTTFTYTVSACTNNNVVVNGDFESGDTGFSSDFGPSGLIVPFPGEYSVMTTFQLVASTWPACDDISNPGDNMMVVNALGIQNQNAWCQDVPVSSGTSYKFSAWVGSLVLDTNIEFFVDGSSIGSFFLPPPLTAACNWEQFSTTWENTGGTGTVEICIQNTTSQSFLGLGIAPVYAIDEIQFIEMCTESADVFIDIAEVEAVIDPPGIIGCGGGALTLDGSGSTTGSNISYQWTTSGGNILGSSSGPTIQVDEAGRYFLKVIYSNMGLTCEDETFVDVDKIEIEVDIAPFPDIDCDGNPITLDGSGSSSGSDISYEWTNGNGSVVGTNITVQVDEPGNYTLAVIYDDGSGYCEDSQTVPVIQIEIDAVIDPLPPPVSCYGEVVEISGSNSSSGPDIFYLWTTVTGNIIGPDDDSFISVDEPGEYILTVIYDDGSVYCEEETSVFIDFIDLFAEIEPAGEVDCIGTPIQLDGSNSTNGPGITLEWRTFDGNIVGSNLGPFIMVDKEGTYQLTVTYFDGIIMCDTFATIYVPQAELEIDIQTPDSLDCAGTPVLIDASNSTSGPGYTYDWSTTDGNILSGANAQTVSVNQAGTYTLTISVSQNGASCIKSESIEVFEDPNIPKAIIDTPSILTCKDTLINLVGDSSTVGTNFSYQWTSMNGGFSSKIDSINTIANSIGTYQLVVTNSSNQCKDSVQIEVKGNLAQPVISVEVPDTLTCRDTSISLIANGVGTPDLYNFNWSALSGNLLSGANSNQSIANQNGIYQIILTDTLNGCRDTSQIEIFENTSIPTLTIQSPQVIDCQIDTIRLNAAGSSIGSNFSINWSHSSNGIQANQNSLNPLINSGGNYQLLIENLENGCKDSLSTFVQIDTMAPIVEAGDPQTFLCNTDSILLNATATGNLANFTYQWGAVAGDLLSGRFTPNTFVGTPGTYLVFVLDTTNNCTGVDTAQVVADINLPNISIIATDTITCLKDSIQLDATGSDAGTNFTFSWNTNDGNFNSNPSTYQPFVTQSGTYQLEIENTDNGCKNLSSITIFENLDTPIVTLNNPDILNCERDRVNLISFISNQPGQISIEWQTADGNILGSTTSPSIEVDQKGIYQLKVTDLSNGCESDLSIEIFENDNIPTFNIVEPDSIDCQTRSIDLIGNIDNPNINLIYSWSSNNGGFLGGINQVAAQTDLPGTYILEVRDTVSKCVFSDTIKVERDIEFPIISIANQDSLECGEERILSAQANTGNEFSYQWTTVDGVISNQAGSLTPTIATPGTYVLSVMNNENGCETKDSITIFGKTGLVGVQIQNQGIDTLNCFNNTTTLSSISGNFDYQWIGNGNQIAASNNIEIEVNEGGIYQVIVTDLDTGCPGTASFEIFEDFEKPQFSTAVPDSLTCTDSLINLEAIPDLLNTDFDYNWYSLDGNIIDNSNTSEPTISESGQYFVEVISNENGCRDTLSVEVFESLKIPAIDLMVSNEINCKFDSAVVSSNISNLSGSETFDWRTIDGNILLGSNSDEITVSKSGTYILQVIDNQTGCESEKEIIVIENLIEPIIELNASNEINCKFDSVEISSTITNITGNEIYNWISIDGNIISGLTSNEILANQAGIYRVQVIDNQTGCASEKEITVIENLEIPPILPIITDTITCNVEEVIITAEVTTNINPEFIWATNNGSIISGVNINEITVDEAGTYSYIIIDLDNFCELQGEVIVEANLTPPTIIIDEPETLTCTQEEVQINASGSSSGGQFSNRWTTDAEGNIVSGANGLGPIVDKPAMYYLRIANIFTGCENIDSIAVERLENDLGNLIVSSIQPNCDSIFGMIQIEDITGSHPPFEYSIDGTNFSDQTVFENLPAGQYELTIRDSLGCEIMGTSQIEVPNSVNVDINPEITLSQGEERQLNLDIDIPDSEIASIEWFPAENLSCDDCKNPIVTANKEVEYSVRVTTNDGCFDEALLVIKIDGEVIEVEEMDIFFPSAFSPNSDGINDLFTGFSNTSKVTQIETLQVFDRWGNKIYEGNDGAPNDISFGWDGTYKTQMMDNGVYVFFAKVELTSGETILVEGDVTLAR